MEGKKVTVNAGGAGRDWLRYPPHKTARHNDYVSLSLILRLWLLYDTDGTDTSTQTLFKSGKRSCGSVLLTFKLNSCPVIGWTIPASFFSYSEAKCVSLAVHCNVAQCHLSSEHTMYYGNRAIQLSLIWPDDTGISLQNRIYSISWCSLGR